MHDFGQSLAQDLGLPGWLEGMVVLPLLAVLLIFGLREMALWAIARRTGEGVHRKVWRRASRLVAVVLSLFAVGLILMSYAGDIASALFTGTQGRFESLLVSIIRVVGYTAVFVVVLVGLRRARRAAITRLEAWRAESGGIRFRSQ